ncbi:hypothetical protein BC332_01728 [Capsicum chinense]|nr:hypothetical protein BC332_01728 [Capsicum chinense]
MAIKFNPILGILLVVIAIILLHISETHGDWEEGSDWKPITNITEEVIEIGKFAVDEHNMEAKTKLEFKEVIKGESKVNKGIYYYCLVISAKDGDFPHNYLAKVWVKQEEKSKNLTSFEECKVNEMGANFAISTSPKYLGCKVFVACMGIDSDQE